MPKSHKRKNAGVGVDFKRAKHKVGKTLPRAANETDASIAARTINLPGQSIAADKAGQAVTHRNLTTKDLISQCGHYSEKVRLDAIRGLTELVKANPDEANRHAASLVAAAAERSVDTDASCRAALRSFLHEALFPALGRTALQPFVPVLMGHVCSALTHLAEPIRVDALALLSVIMDWRPDLVAASYLGPVLHHFADALGRPARGRSLKAGSLAALLSIVSALQAFLTKALATSPSSQTSTRSAQNNHTHHHHRRQKNKDVCVCDGVEDVAQVHGVLMWQRCTWPPHTAAGATSGGRGASTPLLLAAGVPSPHVSARDASTALLRLLLECWSECGASTLNSQPDHIAARCVTCILKCFSLLLDHWGMDLAGNMHTRGSLAADIVDKVGNVFPIYKPSVPTSAPTLEQLVQVNVAAAGLLTTFIPRAVATGGELLGQGSSTHREAAWMSRLLDWLADVMERGCALAAAAEDWVGGGGQDGSPGIEVQREAFADSTATKHSKSHAQSKQSRKINLKQKSSLHVAQQGLEGGGGGGGGHEKRQHQRQHEGVPVSVYTAALDALTEALPLLDPMRRRQLLAAAWTLWTRSAAKSASRLAVLRFLRRIVAQPAQTMYALLPPMNQPLVTQEEVATWIAAMPKFLWELGTSSPAATETGLRLILDAARCCTTAPLCSVTQDACDAYNQTPEMVGRSERAALIEALAACQPQLAPLFAVAVPRKSKGSSSSDAKRLVLGPLASLPLATQALAVDVLYHLPGVSTSTIQTTGLVALCNRSTSSGGKCYSKDIAVRMVDMMSMKIKNSVESSGGHIRDMYWSLLVSILLGGIEGLAVVTAKPEQGAQDGSSLRDSNGMDAWNGIHERHNNDPLVLAACRAALVAASPVQVIGALGPPLLQQAANLCQQTSFPSSSCSTDDVITDQSAASDGETRVRCFYAIAALTRACLALDPACLLSAGCGHVRDGLPKTMIRLMSTSLQCFPLASTMSASDTSSTFGAAVVVVALAVRQPALVPELFKAVETQAKPCTLACALVSLALAQEDGLQQVLTQHADVAYAAASALKDAAGSDEAVTNAKVREALTVLSQRLGRNDLLL